MSKLQEVTCPSGAWTPIQDYMKNQANMTPLRETSNTPVTDPKGSKTKCNQESKR